MFLCLYFVVCNLFAEVFCFRCSSVNKILQVYLMPHLLQSPCPLFHADHNVQYEIGPVYTSDKSVNSLLGRSCTRTDSTPLCRCPLGFKFWEISLPTHYIFLIASSICLLTLINSSNFWKGSKTELLLILFVLVFTVLLILRFFLGFVNHFLGYSHQDLEQNYLLGWDCSLGFLLRMHQFGF